MEMRNDGGRTRHMKELTIVIVSVHDGPMEQRHLEGVSIGRK